MIEEKGHSSRVVFRALAARTEGVEALVRQACSSRLEGMPPAWCALAVGGFGRRELFPHSDVDLMLLVDGIPDSPEDRERLSFFQGDLWDAKLELGYSVHTVEDCTSLEESNLELTVSLLTMRMLAGSSGLYARLVAAWPRFLARQGRAAISRLLDIARARHSRFQGSIYHMEPDVKDSPGALRDLHMIEWLGLLRTTPFTEELSQLEDARAFLFDLRYRLHTLNGRRGDRLSYEAQDALFPNPAAGMREYYRHTREVRAACLRAIEASEPMTGGLLNSFRDWRSRLSNADFTVLHDRVLLRAPRMLDDGTVLRLASFVARHGFRIALDTEKRLREFAQTQGAQALARSGTWPQIREALDLPYAARALRVLQDASLLKVLLPEWEHLECLVTRDFYHLYTVDEHTLVTLDNLERLAVSDDPAHARFRELLAETDDHALLRLALLLHDIGKGGGTGEHASESTRLSKQVLDRIGPAPLEKDTVLFLVEHHIDLSSLMTKKDLHDPDVVRVAAEGIGTLERLQLLTLLTWADIGAVNPTARSPWLTQTLWTAYRALHQELTRELDTDRIVPADAPSPRMASFLAGLPVRYLRRHTRAEVERHFEMAAHARPGDPAIALTHHADGWELVAISPDRPFLFADIAGTLAGFGMNILKAEAFANSGGLTVDTFRFADPLHTLELNPGEVDRLAGLLRQVILGQENVRRLLTLKPARGKFAQSATVTPVISFDDQASAHSTLLTVIAEDRIGLLYDLARAISKKGCNIEVVLINTEAHKAVDVFYVTSAGAKLTAEMRAAVRAALEGATGKAV